MYPLKLFPVKYTFQPETRKLFSRNRNFQTGSQEKRPSSSNMVEKMIELICNSNILTVLVDRQYFEYVKQALKQHYMREQFKERIAKYLMQYIQFSLQLLSQKEQKNEKQIVEFINQFSIKISNLIKELKIVNKWVLQVLDFSEIFYQYSFKLDEDKSLQSTKREYFTATKDVRFLCEKDMIGIFYLSSYLVICCEKMEKEGKNPTEIINILKEKVNELKNFYGVKQTREKQHFLLSREDNLKQLASISMINIPDNPVIFSLKAQHKQQILEDQIFKMVEIAKNSYTFFNHILYQPCVTNGGFAFKSNLKLYGRQNKPALHRVKQKLLGDFLDKCIIPFDKNQKLKQCQTLHEWVKVQKEYVQDLNRQILSKLEQIPFNVTDILRGKCMFTSIQNISKAVIAGKQKIQEEQKKGKKVCLLQIQNRLHGITKDIVFKVKIDELTCQFQFVLLYDKTENEIHHKMYEIIRSKNLSPISILQEWNHKNVKNYFSLLNNVVGSVSDVEKLQKISKRKSILCQFIGFKIDQTSSQNDGNKNFQNIEQIIKKIKSLSFDGQKVKNAQKYKKVRTVGCFCQMENFKLALALLNSNNNQKPNEIVWSELQMFGFIKFKQGKYSEALEIYLKNLQLLKGFSKDEYLQRSAKTYVNIGNAYYGMRKKQEAIQNFNLALEAAKVSKGELSIQYAQVLHNMGAIYSKQGQNIKSLQFLGKALQIKQKIHQKDTITYALTLNNMGGLYFQFGKISEAFNCFFKCLQILEKEKKIFNNDYAMYLMNLGNVYSKMFKHQQALDYYQISLDIYEAVRGKGCYDTTLLLRNIGSTHIDLKNYSEALNYFQRAIDIQESINGKDDINLIQPLTKMGNCLRLLNKLQQAFGFLNRALQISNKINGTGSYDSIKTLYIIGLVYQQKKQYSQAIQVHNKAIEISQKFEGYQTLDFFEMLNSIGNSYFFSGQSQKSLSFYLRSLEGYEKINGKDNIQCANSLNNIGSVYQTLGKFEQSLNYYDRACYINQKVHGKDSSQYCENINNKATAYQNMKKYAEALEYYGRVLEIRQKNKQKSLSQYTATLRNMGQIHQKMGNVLQALQKYKICSQFYEKLKETDLLFEIDFNIGKIFAELEKNAEAILYFQKCLKIGLVEKKFFTHAAILLNTMAFIWEKNGEFNEATVHYRKALSIYEQIQGNKSDNCFVIRLKLGDLLCQLKNLEQGLKQYEECLKIMEERKQENDLVFVKLLERMALILVNLKNYHSSLSYLQRAYSICMKMEGPDSEQGRNYAAYIQQLKSIM